MSGTELRIAEAVSEYLVEPGRAHLLGAVARYDTFEQANEGLHCLTGVRSFFRDRNAFDEFRRVLMLSGSTADGPKNREWGDFQTPLGLASRVCQYLAEIGVSPRIVIEPTYGAGNFILAALHSFPKTELVYGVEVQDRYEWRLKATLLSHALRGVRSSAEIELHRDDIFIHRFPKDILRAQDILVIGNPPWVTNAELGALDASNLPRKRNLKALTGLDAITGKSNFDIGEFILLRILDLFGGQHGTLAVLCKNSVIKNLVEISPRRRFRVGNIRAYSIDAAREFGASVDASLLVMDMGVTSPTFSCRVATLDNPSQATKFFGWAGNRFVSNVSDYARVSELDGESPMVWRQGLKHDCARIMELDDLKGTLVNGNGEIVDIEDQWVYWLLKGSDLGNFEVGRARKKVIITQHRIGESTSIIQISAPRLWEYLLRNSKYLERRKSAIYQGRPRFSIFGIGEYSFRPYKVAISGLHKRPRFSLVLPIDNRPAMLDDTCYFLGFDTYLDALFTASVLNSPPVQQFLQSIVFTDAKRPYTKEALMRVDWRRAAYRLSFRQLLALWADTGYKPRMTVTESQFQEYKQHFLGIGKKQEGLQLGLDV